jgi:hypothetical protein
MYFALKGNPARFRGPGDEAVNGYAISDLTSYERLFRGVEGRRAVGEGSTWYLLGETAAENIRAAVPGCRIVGVLRDPSERAWSAYLHLRRDRREPESDFATALDLEEKRAREGWAWIWRYRGMGFYAEQVKRYQSAFPADQLLWILYEDYRRDPGGVVAAIFRHLGVDPGFRPDFSLQLNATGIPRHRGLHRFLQSPSSVRTAAHILLPAGFRRRVVGFVRGLNFPKPDAPAGAMSELRASFEQDIRKLSSLIGRDLSAWLPGGRGQEVGSGGGDLR